MCIVWVSGCIWLDIVIIKDMWKLKYDLQNWNKITILKVCIFIYEDTLYVDDDGYHFKNCDG